MSTKTELLEDLFDDLKRARIMLKWLNVISKIAKTFPIWFPILFVSCFFVGTYIDLPVILMVVGILVIAAYFPLCVFKHRTVSQYKYIDDKFFFRVEDIVVWEKSTYGAGSFIRKSHPRGWATYPKQWEWAIREYERSVAEYEHD